MDKNKIITELIRRKSIFGTMYGGLPSEPHEDIIEVFTKELYYTEDWGGKGPSIFYIWGWPGPDGTTYHFSDYGKTWAFTKKELKDE